jgi:putative acetyltransferase
MRSEITFRPLRPGDGPALTRLHRRAIILQGVRAYTPDLARSWAYGLDPEDYWDHALNGEAFEVAQLSGAPIGFGSTRGDEVVDLYVDPAFTRRGVGSGLMRRALKRIHDAGHHRARVLAALSGVAFYEAMGFRAIRGRIHSTRGGLNMRVLEMAHAREPEPALWPAAFICEPVRKAGFMA